MGVRNTDRKRHNLYILAVTALFIACLIAVNLLAGKLETERGWAGDFSRGATFSLTDESLRVVDSLKEDILIYAVYAQGARDNTIIGLLSAYAHASGRVHFEMLDLQNDPGKLLKYTSADAPLASGSVIVSNADGSRFKTLDYYSLYMLGQAGIVGISAEQSVSSAMHYVQGGSENRLVYVSGHGEAPIAELADYITNAMARNFTVTQADTVAAGYARFSPKTDILVFASPTEDISEQERDALTAYLKSGGRAAFYMDNSRSADGGAGVAIGKAELTNFNAVFQTAGILLNRDLLLSPEDKATLGRITAFTPAMAESALAYMAVSECSSLTIADTATAVLVSPAACYRKWINDSLNTLDKSAGDATGPFVLSAFGSVEKGRIYVAGTSADVRSGGFLHDGNREAAMRILSLLAGDAGNPYVPPRITQNGTLNISTLTEQIIWSILATAVLPVAALLFGAIVMRKRRRAKAGARV